MPTQPHDDKDWRAIAIKLAELSRDLIASLDDADQAGPDYEPDNPDTFVCDERGYYWYRDVWELKQAADDVLSS